MVELFLQLESDMDFSVFSRKLISYSNMSKFTFFPKKQRNFPDKIDTKPEILFKWTIQWKDS